MANQKVIDETGATQLASLTAGGAEFGSGTPTSNFITIDGTSLNNGSSKIGASRAQPNATSRTVGSVAVGAGSRATITHSIGRLALVEFTNDPIVTSPAGAVMIDALTTTTFRFLNTSGASYTTSYSYV